VAEQHVVQLVHHQHEQLLGRFRMGGDEDRVDQEARGSPPHSTAAVGTASVATMSTKRNSPTRA
jgi:hypothetical protein